MLRTTATLLLLCLALLTHAQDRYTLSFPTAPYTEYGKPITFKVQALRTAPPDTAATPTLYFKLSDGPAGAVLDSLTGDFLWQPNYQDEGRYRSLTIELRSLSGHTYATKTEKLFVADIPTRPEIKVNDYLILKPSEQRTLQVYLAEPSGQPLASLTVFSSNPHLQATYQAKDSTLRLIADNSPTLVAATVTLEAQNQVDRLISSKKIEVQVTAQEQPPRFFDTPVYYEVVEGHAVALHLPAYDPNGDAIYYSFKELEQSLENQLHLDDPYKGEFTFDAALVGERDEQVFPFRVEVTDNHSPAVTRDIKVRVVRSLPFGVQEARKNTFTATLHDFYRLRDSVSIFHEELSKYIQKRKNLRLIADWGVFAVSAALAIAANTTDATSKTVKELTIVSAVVAGAANLLKPDMSSYDASRDEVLRLKNDLATTIARSEIQINKHLNPFALSGSYQDRMDDLAIAQATYRYRFHQVYDGSKFAAVRQRTQARVVR